MELHPAALEQMKGLPSQAFDALLSRTVDLLEEPWDARYLYPGESEYRQTTFGDAGIMYFKVDEAQTADHDLQRDVGGMTPTVTAISAAKGTHRQLSSTL
ncbi:hypothetical protein [Acrocarpospora corrugata]|uniref:hypothetical protein n=1 Tax=Acrocarpospora corrugata TaxID=35763 RepID=UPI0012D2FF66|nr:hypothetical protein [Acrocarpospora corrugata]